MMRTVVKNKGKTNSPPIPSDTSSLATFHSPLQFPLQPQMLCPCGQSSNPEIPVQDSFVKMNSFCCGSSLPVNPRSISHSHSAPQGPPRASVSSTSGKDVVKAQSSGTTSGGSNGMLAQGIGHGLKDETTCKSGFSTSNDHDYDHASISKDDHFGGGDWRSQQKGGEVTSLRHAMSRSFSGDAENFYSIRKSFEGDADFKINDLVGNGISGMLYKWVNYGKGWRERWFVLQDGVLSYYKVHGPDRICIDQEIEKGGRVIGEESIRRMSRRYPRQQDGSDSGTSRMFRGMPIGEVHLKVSSIRESRSDHKRFTIFSGTKRLHLRAETNEIRRVWLDALRAIKEMFPRMPNSQLMVPADNFVVSTEKLRMRLVEEGVNNDAVQDIEQIVKTEFSGLLKQLVALKQKQSLLLDTLRQLEREKVDLEDTVVDESRRHEYGYISRSRIENLNERILTDSDDESGRQDVVEEETEDEDNAFLDTKDFLSSNSFKSTKSDPNWSPLDSENGDLYGIDSFDVIEPSMKLVGFDFPVAKRRRKLPDPVEKEKGVSLWSMIKDNIGKDLTKVCLPVYFNEPLSSLQKCFEDLEYSYLIDRAYAWGKQGNSLMRILNVAAFAVSGYSSTEGRNCKPFNPLLGETFEADFPDKGLRFFSEKVSHHPMIVACHCEGNGWRFWGDCNLKSKFWGRSIQLDPLGVLTLEFDDGEVFQWSKVTTSIYNLILGKLYCDHYGTMRIQGNRDFSCKLKFKEQSIIDRNPHQVQGIVQDLSRKTVATLFGKWDESMHYTSGDYSGKGKGSEPSCEACLLWRRAKPSYYPTRYNLTRFAITLNELTPELKEKLPPTDSRLRPDQRCLENGEYEMANAEKLRLEQRQRQARKMQEKGWKPRWFAKEKGSSTFSYVGGYWESKEQGNWESCPDIFGQVPADQKTE